MHDSPGSYERVLRKGCEEAEDSEEPMLGECFECSGLVGRCASCSGLIACGVHHAGRLRFNADSCELLGACTSDYATLTFQHKGPCFIGDAFASTPDVSAKWERLLLPLAATPGADVGVTMPIYLRLLKQCRAKADWQLRTAGLHHCPGP